MIWSVVIDILKLGSERRFPTQARSPGRFSPVVAAWRSVVPGRKKDSGIGFIRVCVCVCVCVCVHS